MYSVNANETPIHYPSNLTRYPNFEALAQWFEDHLKMCLEKGYFVKLTKPLHNYDPNFFEVQVWTINKANELTAYHQIEARDEDRLVTECSMSEMVAEVLKSQLYDYRECTRPLPNM